VTTTANTHHPPYSQILWRHFILCVRAVLEKRAAVQSGLKLRGTGVVEAPGWWRRLCTTKRNFRRPRRLRGREGCKTGRIRCSLAVIDETMAIWDRTPTAGASTCNQRAKRAPLQWGWFDNTLIAYHVWLQRRLKSFCLYVQTWQHPISNCWLCWVLSAGCRINIRSNGAEVTEWTFEKRQGMIQRVGGLGPSLIVGH